MKSVSTKLQQVVATVVEGLGYELVGVEYIPQGKNSILRAYIDKDDGIVIEDCEKVSRQLSGVLDVEDIVKGYYNLEISSPGLDRPLFNQEHFERFSGNQVKVRLYDAVNGRKRITGTLCGLEEGDVVVEIEDGGRLLVAMENIKKAQLVPEI